MKAARLSLSLSAQIVWAPTPTMFIWEPTSLSIPIEYWTLACHNKIEHFKIPKEGFVLHPNILYLGVTEEYTETHNSVPFLEGKSSIGRLGIDIHATAGKGDVGFCNTWTLEISCTQPVRVYPGMPIGQLIYFMVEGDIKNYYNKKKNAKYIERTDKPVESMMWRNKF